jgi:hypothetical protein
MHEREDRLRVHGHLRLGPIEPVTAEDVVVVLDDSVVDADDGGMADRVVVGGDLGVTLREVTDVHERGRRGGGEGEILEEGARTPAQLRHLDGRRGCAVCVPDRVRAALRDPRQQGARGERSADGGVGAQAESGYAAHERFIVDSPSDDTGSPRLV